MHLDGLVGLLGPLGRIQRGVDVAEVRVDVQERGSAGPDADLELAGRRLKSDRAAHDLADADAADRGLGLDGGMRVVDRDVAVGRARPQVARDLADPDLAVGAPDRGRAVDGADTDPARGRGDVGVADRAVDDDVAE